LRRDVLVDDSGTDRFKPPADINLRMGFAAIVPCVGRVGSLSRPLEDAQRLIAAVDNHPFHRIIALFSADLTSVNPVNHKKTSAYAIDTFNTFNMQSS
jgi:hypothetical protein